MSTEIKKCECHEICVNAVSDILKEFNTHEQPNYNNIIKLFKEITRSDISCIYIVNSGEYFFDLGMSHIETDNSSPELKRKQERCCPLILSYYRNILTAGNHIHFSSLEEIPEDLKEVNEAFRERDINSVIIVPIISEIHDLLGILIFEYKEQKINISDPIWDFIFLAAKIFSYQLSHKFVLQNKEDKYGFLVKSVNLILYTLDNNGIITSITPNISTYGYSPENIIGKNFSKFVHVDDIEKVIQSFEVTKETKEVTPIVFRSSDINGKTIWFEENGKAELDAKGNVVAMHCYLRDITERMEGRLKLQESEEKYRTVVELAHEGIVIIQGEKIVYANNETVNMVGASTKEILTVPFIKYVAPEYIISVAQKYMQHHNGEIEDYTQKIDLLHSNGKNVPVEINSTIISYNGEPASLIFIRNLTETIEIEKALVRSEKLAAVGTLAGGVAHEFNNINVAILGFAQLALQTKELDDELKSWLERICNGAKRAGNITKKLLSFSQPSETKSTRSSIPKIMDETLQLISNEFSSEGITIKRNYLPIPEIMMDPNQISQVMLNMIINARHAMIKSEEKIISIETGKENNYIYFSITDTGCGIKTENKDKIFSPFYTTKGEYAKGKDGQSEVKGTGLGLSISHNIIASHNGYITVESSPKKGTKFTVKLPARKSRQNKREEKPVKAQKTDVQDASVLVIDDEADTRDLFKLLLPKHGYKVTTADDGNKATEILREASVDVVIVDIQMPKMNGCDFLESLNNMSPKDRPVAIVLSGRISGHNMKRLKKLEVFKIIEKPFEIDNICRVIFDAVKYKNKE